MKYFWQHKDFPNFSFDVTSLLDAIESFAVQLGEVNGLYKGLNRQEQEDFLIQITLSEAMKTSEIEGEYFSRIDIMSSIRNQLGIQNHLPQTRDKKAKAIAKLMLQVRNDYNVVLTTDVIQNWHSILFQDDRTINAGQWRTGTEPMQIISGSFGNIQVHYEAPPSQSVPLLMEEFVKWYNSFSFDGLGKVGQAMLRTSLAHLYFETIHPFEDGNGRIGRAISEKALAQTLEIPLYISLSKKIEENKKQYYAALKEAQKSKNITDWLNYFFDIIIQAEKEVKETIVFTIEKSKFFDSYKTQLNERQTKAIQKMLEYGKDGFEGGMTAKKYISINNTSKATATRDLQELTQIGVFVTKGSGRSVRYELNF